jgi:hypothetical protein
MAMRGLVAALVIVLVCGMTALTGSARAETKEAQEFTVGQWGGYSYTDDANGQFIDCEIWASGDGDVQFGIAVSKDYSLQLWLYSKPWNLPENQTYPISYWVDRNQQYRGRASTYVGKTVLIDVDRDQDVYDELQAGGEITFRTQNQDYSFSLRGSRAALSRLLECVDQHAKVASTNPFGGSQQSDDNQPAQQNAGQQNNGGDQQQASAGNPSSVKLKELTRSADQMRQFLVDVTGAKPSMIAVEAKADKAGFPHYEFSTPLGAGQFWQEYLGNDTLRDIVLDYFRGYKDECKGQVEQDVKEPVQGKGGQMIVGIATCSNSPYQNNGAEVLSYSLIAADNVISIYVTYAGGNAAKAKSDSLGKLIARRSEDLIQ